MIITREQQEKLLKDYDKGGHSPKQVMGFVDGMIAMLELIDKTIKESKQ